MASFCAFADELGTETVEFYVGADRQKFVVHKNPLVTQSKYFRGALTGTLYKEAVEGVVSLEEDDPAAFRLLVCWVYRHTLPRIRPFVVKPDFSKYKSTSTPSRRSGKRVPLSTKKPPGLNVELPDSDDETSTVRHAHISAEERFIAFSPEEVRLADYDNALENCPDPLRRDAGVTKSDKAGSERKKKVLSRGRREWLDRQLPPPIVTSPTTARAPASASDLLNPTLPGDGSNRSPENGKSGEQAVPALDKVGQGDALAPPKSTPQSDVSSVPPVPPAHSLLHSQPAFTFRAETPPPSNTQAASISCVIGPDPKPVTHLTYAAVAAIGGQQQSKPARDRDSSSATSVAGSETRHQKRPKSAKPTQTVQASASSAPVALPQPPQERRTAEDWATIVSRQDPDAGGDDDAQSDVSGASEDDEAEHEGGGESSDWPFKTNPEANVLKATHWLDWKADPNAPVFHGRDEAFRENSRHQLALLRLVVMAEKFCWDELFNAAMDAYLDGEVVMNRVLVPLDHLEMAYAKCYPSSPLRRFFADMVHFEVKTLLTHSRYLDLAQTYEDFLVDLFKHLDYKTWLPGKSPFTVLRNPLTVRKCQYHHHEDWTGCCTF